MSKVKWSTGKTGNEVVLEGAAWYISLEVKQGKLRNQSCGKLFHFPSDKQPLKFQKETHFPET